MFFSRVTWNMPELGPGPPVRFPSLFPSAPLPFSSGSWPPYGFMLSGASLRPFPSLQVPSVLLPFSFRYAGKQMKVRLSSAADRGRRVGRAGQAPFCGTSCGTFIN